MYTDTTARILHLIHTPRLSGAEALVRDLCLHHGEQGAVSAIAAFAPAEPTYSTESSLLESRGVSLYFPSRPLHGLQRIRHFRSTRKTFAPTVIFAHSVLPSFYGRSAQPFFGRKPKFVTVLHGASNDDFASPELQVCELLTRHRSDKIITVSALGASNYQRRFGIQPSVQIIPNGIRLDMFSGIDRQTCRERLGLKHDEKMILQVGRISPVKEQELSIRALAAVVPNFYGKLWLAGLTEDQEYERYLRKLVDELSLQNRVKFLGARSDIADLLGACDLYLMPSRAEAHSVAIIEALTSGVPIVASDIPSFQFCRDQPGVSLIDLADLGAFSNTITRNANLGRFQRNVNEYSIERTAQSYLEVARN